MFSIIYSPGSTYDLLLIKNYIKYTLLNPQAADRIENEIKKHISLLSFSPKMYLLVHISKDKREIRRLPVLKYNVYYSIDEHNLTVETIRIVYSGADLNQIAN